MKNFKCSFADWCKDNDHQDWLDLWDYAQNQINPNDISCRSTQCISFTCPDCGCVIPKTLYDLTYRPFNCPRCGDGSSYPNKYVYEFLLQLQKKNGFTISQEHVFDWSKRIDQSVHACKRYDFYVNFNGRKIIIEVHGEQHFNGSFYRYGHSAQYEISNDIFKKNIAIQNGILEDNYIVIDARKSDANWIKNSILQCGISSVLPFNEDDIDWMQCHKVACKSLVKVVSELWNSGIHSTEKIANIIGKTKSTVIAYMKKASDAGLCLYNANYSKQIRTKPILCVNNNYVFASDNVCSNVSEQVFGCKIHRSSIYKVAAGARKSVYNLNFQFITKEEFLKIKQARPEYAYGDIFYC